ncbi:hypothetical protein V2J09_003640 [Rumex salicifolius]
MAGNDHPRRIIRGFLPLDVCKELEFIHKSNCTVGYRPNVFSTTLSHLIATNSSHLIMPFVALRERIKEEVEQAFGCEFELFVEFTGLISWTKGASIGWHSDDNRPYLKQRDFAAVCYLNSYREHFKGGLFHFQNGEPETIVPMAGDVIMYTADSRNVHLVDEITNGERLTLTLWFTRDANHDEDVKLLSHLSQSSLPCLHDELASLIPQPGSTNMYWFSSQQLSDQQEQFDIRFARLALLGYNILPSEDERRLCELASPNDPLEILMVPLHLIRGENLLDTKFDNILHALQVVQFYNWKREVPQELDSNCNIIPILPLSKSQLQGAQRARDVLLKDARQAERALVYPSCGTSTQHLFDEVSFSDSLIKWEAYSRRLQKHLQESIPHWRNHQSIIDIPSDNGQ